MAIPRRSSFSIPRQWNARQVPSWPVEIDRAHPLCPERLYIPGLGLRDLTGAGGGWAVGPGNPAWGQTPAGTSNSWSGASNLGWSVGSGHYLGGLSSWTISALVQTSAADVNIQQQVIYCERAGAGNDILKMIGGNGTTGSTTCPGGVLRNDGGTIVNQRGCSVAGAKLNDGLQHLATVTFDTTNVTGYTDATLAIQTGWGASNSFTDGSTVQSVGYDTADTGASWNGAITAVFLFRRTLDIASIEWLSTEPFAMLRPVIRRYYFSPPPSGIAATPFLVNWS